MKVIINDKEHVFDLKELALIDMLNKVNMKPTGLIVELDGMILKSNEFTDAVVKDGSRVELIRIVGGG